MPHPPPLQHPSGGGDDSKLFALLSQKEEELKELRGKYEESQAKLQNQTVELSRLQSKLEVATANLEQERKITRLETEAAANEKLEVLLEKQREEHRETMKQMQQQMSQAAAAIALARNEAPPPPVLSQSHPSIVKRNISAANEQQPQTQQRGMGLPKKDEDYATVDDDHNDDDHDDDDDDDDDHDDDDENRSYPEVMSIHTEENHELPSKFEKGFELPFLLDDSTLGSSIIEPPPLEYSSRADATTPYVAIEEKKLAPPSAPTQAKFKPWEHNYHEDANNSVVDEVSMGGSAIDALAAVTVGNTKTTRNKNNINSNINKKSSDNEPVNEKGDIFDAEDAANHFTPKYSDPKEQTPILEEDNQSLGHTVASSTYGEDRQKVANKTLLDPYGDRGVYTGVVLRTTGMPHGLGRMVYEEDGRVFEGDWYVHRTVFWLCGGSLLF
jgi:hypothetical protein